MILLLRRSRVNAVALSTVVFFAAGLAVAALEGCVVGRVEIGVPESLSYYLLPYYSSFQNLYPAAEIEFFVVSDSDFASLAETTDEMRRGEGQRESYDEATDALRREAAGGFVRERSSGLSRLHAWILPETSVQQLRPGLERATGTGLTVTGLLYAKFTPAVSVFNPIQVVSIEALRMVMEGEISDWAGLEPGWTGEIKLATYDHNPAESMVSIGAAQQRIGQSGRPSASVVHQQFANHVEFVDYLRLEPFGMGLVPLSAIAPGVNPVRVIGDAVVRDGCIVSTVCVLEPIGQSLLGRLQTWIRRRFGHTRVLRAFLDHIQQVDDSLLGSKAVTLVAVGDIMLDRGVRQAMNRHGLTHPFEGTQQVLSSADIAFANLETPISSRGNPLNMFRAYPDVMKALRYSGLDVVSIANNHILDYDYIALYDTIEYLDTAGIHHVGAGANEAAARRHKVIESNGLRIAFLAYTELWFCYTKDNRDVDATESRPGVAPLREDVLVEDVARAKADSDFVVVSCHWGEEYKHYPNQTQQHFAEVATAAGANLVLGHHPHVLQGLAFGDCWVTAYSLGNFIFDQRQPGTQDSVILRFTISKDRTTRLSGGRIIRVDVLPCYIVDCQPILLAGDAKRRALLEMSRFSSAVVSSDLSASFSTTAKQVESLIAQDVVDASHMP